ncbi:malonate decarboxylase holo-[acyl-carrier-protein] synthase [Massilia sp. LjRoot122]|uniref:malonate decarboxylase holo-[acyl-carrier-protein] synthase n=1 Tax=Massilia sp. LjRoot122 TaxID=3342257 RepID=UPI003ED0F58B
MFARHDLVWLSSRGWERVRAAAPLEAVDALDLWRDGGWPAVVRRAETDLLPGEVAVGFALPPRRSAAGARVNGEGKGGKLRVGCRVDLSDVTRRTRALPLVGALDAVPPEWHEALAALEREAAAAGIGLAVYGSVALEALTGQPYLTPASDIDLLLQPLSRAQLMAGLDLLARHAAVLPLDGEVVFADGRAVAWKELRAAFDSAAGTRVLAKGLERIALVTPDELIATLEGQAWLN